MGKSRETTAEKMYMGLAIAVKYRFAAAAYVYLYMGGASAFRLF